MAGEIDCEKAAQPLNVKNTSSLIFWEDDVQVLEVKLEMRRCRVDFMVLD